jgi:predicted aspartyl protease
MRTTRRWSFPGWTLAFGVASVALLVTADSDLRRLILERHAGAWNDTPGPASDRNRQVIALAKITDGRCHVSGFANNAPFVFEIDTGDPIIADFSASAIGKLGLRGPLRYQKIWPGTRYGGSATATLRELRIGAWVLTNVDVRIMQNWRFTFGDDESPLLGLAALQSRGIRFEVEGDTCRLTLPAA